MLFGLMLPFSFSNGDANTVTASRLATTSAVTPPIIIAWTTGRPAAATLPSAARLSPRRARPGGGPLGEAGRGCLRGVVARVRVPVERDRKPDPDADRVPGPPNAEAPRGPLAVLDPAARRRATT